MEGIQLSLFDLDFGEAPEHKSKKQYKCEASAMHEKTCDCQFGSLNCFIKRGYMYDPQHAPPRKNFLQDEKGRKIREPLRKRECKLLLDSREDNQNSQCDGCEYCVRDQWYPGNMCRHPMVMEFHSSSRGKIIEYSKERGFPVWCPYSDPDRWKTKGDDENGRESNKDLAETGNG